MSMQNIRVYTGELIEGIPTDLPMLFPNFGSTVREREFFSNAGAPYIKEPIFDIVADPAQAEYFLIPYNYFNACKHGGYVEHFIEFSNKYDKEIIIFDYTDYHEDIPVPNAVIFRYSLYRHQKKNYEYAVPPFTEDLSIGHPFEVRRKSIYPVISFCGWAGFTSFSQRLKFHIKNLRNDIKQLLSLDRGLAVYKQGIYFRIKALSVLKKSPLVQTNFIIRSSFSGHAKTISLDLIVARREYIENIANSDFVLMVKGDGNCSMRFYEALSLGRIPLFVDTDCVLPIEDELCYGDFMVKVDYRDIWRIDSIIADYYAKLSEKDFIEMQKSAKRAFVEHLRSDMFLKHIVKILRGRIQADKNFDEKL